MSKAMVLNQIEQQIEALTPVEQVMMLERIVIHLKQLLLSQPTTVSPQKVSKAMTEKLNTVYKVENSQLDRQLYNAQTASISRDIWQ